MLEKWHFDVICKSKKDNAYAIVLMPQVTVAWNVACSA